MAPHGKDLDGDGHLDILVGLYEQDQLVWHKNLGDGTFGSRVNISNDQKSFIHLKPTIGKHCLDRASLVIQNRQKM